MTNSELFWLIILAVVTLGPSIALCTYIYKKDRVEKEPIPLLLMLFGFGMAICIPAGFLNSFNISFVNSIFPSSLSYSEYALYLFLTNVVCVGVVEEGLKWLVMFLITHNSKQFNSYFDGIIYSVYVSLGFATFENVHYVLQEGINTAIVRSITAVPGHMLFAVLMGLFYSEWHARRDARRIESSLSSYGMIAHAIQTKFPTRSKLVLSYLVPVVVHGIYDCLCDLMDRNIPLSVPIFFVFLIALYIFGFIHVSKFSKSDAKSSIYAIRMINKAYPGVLRLEDRVATAQAGSTLITINEDMKITKTVVMPNGTATPNPYSGFPIIFS